MTERKHAVADFIKRAVVALAVILTPASLDAQGCAMCYQSAAASGQRTIHALNSGILILLFPPMVITLGICYIAYKKRDQFNETV